MSKRRLLAIALQKLGILHMLERVKSKPGILIVNHHRVGDASQSRFDRGVFSTTEDELDQQIKFFKKHLHVVHGEELEDLVFGKAKLTRMHVAITFDDGYLDNYTSAFPVLKSNDVGAAFFLVPEYAVNSSIPWWDEIAYLIRNTKKSQLTLAVCGPLVLNLGKDREPAILEVLHWVYKQRGNALVADLLTELREQSGCTLPDVARRFIGWEQAKDMLNAGMVIGSHTQTHRILSQLTPEEQRWELETSRREISENIGHPVTTLAYPVGAHYAFTNTTQEIARDLGYKMCFSFYHGVNTPQNMNVTDIKRLDVNRDPLLFRTETLLNGKLGKLPF